MARADVQDADDFLEFIEIVEDVLETERLHKRYIRDIENPLEKFRDDEFQKRYRFAKDSVRYSILTLIENQLEKINNRGVPVPSVIQLLVCLRFFATGNYQVVSGDLRGISQATVSVIIKRVSEMLAQQMAAHEAQQRENITKFWQIAGLPDVAACVNCTHVPIASPGGDNAEVFRNRKGYFSLNVQITAGPHMEILDIVVRHPGSTHDSVIFDRSSLRIRFEQHQVRGLLLGDNGYPCRPYLLTPVIQPNGVKENHYNAAHIRTRNIVERVFGIWKRRFPCLRRILPTKLQTSTAIICACAVLHNIAIHRGDNLEYEVIDDNMPIVNNVENNELGLMFRREFINRHF